MNERDFCYWLKGFFELSEKESGINSNQVKIIKDHLELVFKKETPDRRIGFLDTVKFNTEPATMPKTYCAISCSVDTKGC